MQQLWVQQQRSATPQLTWPQRAINRCLLIVGPWHDGRCRKWSAIVGSDRVNWDSNSRERHNNNRYDGNTQSTVVSYWQHCDTHRNCWPAIGKHKGHQSGTATGEPTRDESHYYERIRQMAIVGSKMPLSCKFGQQFGQSCFQSFTKWNLWANFNAVNRKGWSLRWIIQELLCLSLLSIDQLHDDSNFNDTARSHENAMVKDEQMINSIWILGIKSWSCSIVSLCIGPNF